MDQMVSLFLELPLSYGSGLFFLIQPQHPLVEYQTESKTVQSYKLLQARQLHE